MVRIDGERELLAVDVMVLVIVEQFEERRADEVEEEDEADEPVLAEVALRVMVEHEPVVNEPADRGDVDDRFI